MVGWLRVTKPSQVSKRICYLAPDVAIPSPRGSSVHVLELSRSLSALGHQVHIICRRVEKSSSPSEKIGDVTVHRVYRWIVRAERGSSFSTNPSGLSKSRILSWLYYVYLITIFRLYISLYTISLIRKNKLQVIIERETSFGAGGLASLLTRRPMILEIVGPRYSRISAWRSKSILYYTESMLRSWIDRKKCVPIFAGVDLSVFREDAQLGREIKDKLKLSDDDFIVGYVGTFQEWHGIDTLLESSKILKEKGSAILCLLVGPGFKKYESMARNLCILESCFFTGPVEYHEVPRYVNACSAMVAPYNPSVDPLRREYGIGWPIKILEYMACGKPVISTSVEPINRIITDRSTGILVRPGSQTELASALEALISNQSFSKDLGKKGKDSVKANYTWSAVAEAISPLIQ